MKTAAVWTLLLGCSGLAPDPGIAKPTAETVGGCPNPDECGICVVPNGVDLEIDSATGTYCLAQYQNPTGELPTQLIVLAMLATWSTPSRELADLIDGTNLTGTNTTGADWVSTFGPEGVVFIEDLVDANAAALKAWTAQYDDRVSIGTGVPTEADGLFFDAAAIPVVFVIDARTMTLVSADVGVADPAGNAIADALAAVKSGH